MDFKTGKLHKIIREFEKGNGRYEINGIDLKNTVFLYREKAGAFIPIPKGNYKTIFNDNESILEVDDVINNKAIEFQIISIFDVQSYKYLEKYPELKMVVVQTNKIVDDINNIIGYLNSVGVKTDSKYQTQILTPLEPLSVWYMNAEGLIDTLPIDDFNKKFKEIIEKMSELADEKAREQVKKRLDELKTEIESFKNKKISEVLKELKTEKDNSIKEIEKIKEKSKNELNSRMPEINNKFNGIAGGTINPTFIQDDGEKIEGQYYLDRPTGKLYRCIKTTSNTVNSAEYFKDVSLDSIVNRLENLITFDNNNALKIKIITVTLNTNILIGDSINVDGIPNTTVFVTGFLYNYIKQEKTNIYEYWDLQVSHPNKCIIRKIKNYGFTSYATILVFYK
ncbi:hypothetical protein [Fusobacterium animalis]|uniref:hypothetical protein n=1 Tax=Fusobacterium animalis TaxID=76859 RepID=UPI000A3E7218|nr:hypothetical protein [Fusobacterium animalis]